jgi:hypothetical protein
MEDELINLLENSSIEITFKSRIPYLCFGTTDDYGMIEKISIGDHSITGYNGICRENISQETMNKIKTSIIKILKNKEYDF